MNTTEIRPASEKQIAFIESLKAQRDTSGDEATMALNLMKTLQDLGQFGAQAASAVIDVLKQAPYPARAQAAPQVDLEGMHKFGGVIFKVQRAVNGSGNLYAKALVEDGHGGWNFEYTPGAIRNLSESTRLSLEEAKQFGALYGTCCACGRTLTDEESIAAGIGPVCAGKF